MNPWAALAWLVVTLLLLLVLSRQVTRALGELGYLLAGDGSAAALLTFAVLLPGIFLHELSHWLAARALQLKTGKFRIWPQVQKNTLRLGYVEVQEGGVVRDSLVGLAPFLLGSGALLLIGFGVFNLSALGSAWQTSGPAGLWAQLQASLSVADAWIWLYLVFAISNAMMPSESDRQPLKSVTLFIALLTLAAVVFGALPTIPLETATRLARAFNTLSFGFAFAIGVDLLFLIVILLGQAVVTRLARR